MECKSTVMGQWWLKILVITYLILWPRTVVFKAWSEDSQGPASILWRSMMPNCFHNYCKRKHWNLVSRKIRRGNSEWGFSFHYSQHSRTQNNMRQGIAACKNMLVNQQVRVYFDQFPSWMLALVFLLLLSFCTSLLLALK